MPENTVWAHGPDGSEWHRVLRRWGGSLPTACGGYVRGPVRLRHSRPDDSCCGECSLEADPTYNVWTPVLDSLPPIWPVVDPAFEAAA